MALTFLVVSEVFPQTDQLIEIQLFAQLHLHPVISGLPFSSFSSLPVMKVVDYLELFQGLL